MASSADNADSTTRARVPLFVVSGAHLAAVAGGAAVLGVVLAGVLLMLAGRAGTMDVTSLDVLAGGVCGLVGVVLTLVPVALLSGRPMATAATAVVFSGFGGGLLAAGCAAGVFVALGLSGPGFWFVFLAGMLGAMIGKMTVVLPSLNGTGLNGTGLNGTGRNGTGRNESGRLGVVDGVNR